MTRLTFAGVLFLVTLCTAGVKSQKENTFINKGDQYTTLGESENVIKIKNPFFLFADREGRSKGLLGRSRNDLETNEIEKDRRPLFVFRPYYSPPNSQYSLQPPHPEARPIFEIRKRRDVSEVLPETGNDKSSILARVKRTHKCRKCDYGVQPVYVQPVVSQPVVAQPVYTQPVYQPVYVKPTYVKPVVVKPTYVKPIVVKQPVIQPVVHQPVVHQPVVAQPVLAQPVQSGCNTCGGQGGGGSYSFSQSSASSSSGSFGYGKK